MRAVRRLATGILSLLTPVIRRTLAQKIVENDEPVIVSLDRDV
jgi:hypothetical protein